MEVRAGLFSLAVAIMVAANHIQGSASLAVMSVDLSSEWLKVALVKPGVPMEIVLNKESRRKTPVMVSIKDGEVQFGDAALAVGLRYPQNAYFYMQDLLAKKLDSPAVQNYMKRFPYVQLGEDEERGTVYFKSGEDKYYPEELLAIVLNKSRELAEDFAEQRVKEAVITVPAFFNQAERDAVMYAAELAEIKVLQLMNDIAAVALNYGVFRRNDFNSTVHNVMFFDMGAGSTTVSIVGYQIVKTKEKTFVETNPQLVVKGLGFDRTLGGLEIDLRLRDYLAETFHKTKKTSKDVREVPRAMSKLFKEANRLKKVLSANMDHMAQVENVMEEQDLRHKVSRAELETMCADLFERISRPIDMALKSSELSMSEIDSIILVGGGTRVPKVQETLMEVTKRSELGKNINADEAAALGAVYQAAHLSKGFKVKKFIVKDANVYPIQVEFQRVGTDDDGQEVTKTVKRTLFGQNNPFPQKKVMTFNRHKTDFSFTVSYKDLELVLKDDDLKSFGSTNLMTYTLKGVEKALKKRSDAESKGIKAHFRLDESGVLHLDTVESVFEKTENVMVEVNETEEEQSTLQKLGKTISSFFSGSSDDTTDATEKKPEGEDGATDEEAPAKEDGNVDKESDQEPKQEGTEEEKSAEKTQDEEEVVKETGDSEDVAEKTQEEEVGEEEETPKDEAEETGETETKGDEQEAEKEAGEQESPEEQAEDLKDVESKQDAPQEADETDDKKEEKSEEKSEEKKESSKEKKKKKKNKKKGGKEETKKETKTVSKPKVVTIKENLTVEAEVLGIPEPSKDARKASRNKLKELRKREEERIAKEQAMNSLESFIYSMQEKLYEEEYEKCSTEAQREKISTKLREASDWLYEVEDDAFHTVFSDKLKELKKVTKNLSFRVKEYKERPQLIADLKQLLNVSSIFLSAAKNASKEIQLFTEVEMGLLGNAYNSTMEWYAEKSQAQLQLSDTEKPVLLSEDLKTKMVALDRELRYLVNKAKAGPPKKKDKPKKKKKSNETVVEGDINGNKSKINISESAEPIKVMPLESNETKEDVPETIKPQEDYKETEEEPLQLPAPDEVAGTEDDTKEEVEEAVETTEKPSPTTAEQETNTDNSRNTGDL
ncbi:hypoxia up-regulated protein 1-like [Asterias rubens]|uniref:hypoxia up-regulated protein 1-like n=1 Tax=Asterias rubens TaxID=7604 RepID=UPI0014556714|nr:hypoxia up-regulated protein 1-like [Asterias rubens]